MVYCFGERTFETIWSDIKMEIIHEQTGRHYSHWTVLGFHEVDKHNDARWWCKCELCGRVYSVRGFVLRNGTSTRCRLHRKKVKT